MADDYLDYDHYSSTEQSLVNFHCHDALSNCSFEVVEGCSDFYGDAVIACNTGMFTDSKNAIILVIFYIF